jgi:hypothetical protein
MYHSIECGVARSASTKKLFLRFLTQGECKCQKGEAKAGASARYELQKNIQILRSIFGALAIESSYVQVVAALGVFQILDYH